MKLQRYTLKTELLQIYNNQFELAWTPVYGLVKVNNESIHKIKHNKGLFNSINNTVIVKYYVENCMSILFDNDCLLSKQLNESKLFDMLMES